MTDEPVRIEPMRERHLDAVLDIERRSFPAPWTRGMFEQEVAERAFARPFVAIRDGAVVGFAITWFLADEAHVLDLAVDPAHRRRGVARALMRHVMQRAHDEGRRLVTLEVRPANVAARALYASFGFREVARRRGYYTDTGEDALVMVCDLEAAAGEPGGARDGRRDARGRAARGDDDGSTS